MFTLKLWSVLSSCDTSTCPGQVELEAVKCFWAHRQDSISGDSEKSIPSWEKHSFSMAYTVARFGSKILMDSKHKSHIPLNLQDLKQSPAGTRVFQGKCYKKFWKCLNNIFFPGLVFSCSWIVLTETPLNQSPWVNAEYENSPQLVKVYQS